MNHLKLSTHNGVHTISLARPEVRAAYLEGGH